MNLALLHLADPSHRVFALDPVVILIACLALGIMMAAIWAPSTPTVVHRSRSAAISSSWWERVTHGRPAFTRSVLEGSPRSTIAAGLVAVVVVAAAFVAYLTMYVPVRIPMIAGAEAHRYWSAAIAAALAVAIYVAAVTAWTMRERRRTGLHKPSHLAENALTTRAVAPGLRFQGVPARITRISAIASCAGVIAGFAAGLPPWWTALAALLPWLPALTVEALWKYERYGLYAFFLVITGLQIGHVGEHAAQVTQLLATNGDLDRSHGVFGQLDFETVHFFWDTAIWLSAGLLCARLLGGRWLWVSFAAASMHEVEHVYLYWLYLAHYDFYMGGGLAGIFGRGGVIGSPLYRPYLHFLYNLGVAAPMLIGLLEQTRAIAHGTRGRPLGEGRTKQRGAAPATAHR